MSVEALATTLHHSKASGTTKLVLLGIANQEGDGGSFPKTATLAKYANVHPRRIPAAIAKLVELGELRVEYKEGGDRRMPDYLRPNVYEVLVECPPGCDRTKQHRVRDEDGDLVTYSRAQKGPKPKQRRAVDNPPTPSDENSTSAENSTTKNHPLKPSIEHVGLASVSTSPAANTSLCWACGETGTSAHRTYCTNCESSGRNNPMVSCKYDGCNAGVQRRTYPGQQFFDCGDHSEMVVA